MPRFADLEENTIYYAQYITLYEDDNGILWCSDSFSEIQENNRMCSDHTIKVIKREGRLHHFDNFGNERVERGVFDKWAIRCYGGGMVYFMKTKIPFANPLPQEN